MPKKKTKKETSVTERSAADIVDFREITNNILKIFLTTSLNCLVILITIAIVTVFSGLILLKVVDGIIEKITYNAPSQSIQMGKNEEDNSAEKENLLSNPNGNMKESSEKQNETEKIEDKEEDTTIRDLSQESPEPEQDEPLEKN